MKKGKNRSFPPLLSLTCRLSSPPNPLQDPVKSMGQTIAGEVIVKNEISHLTLSSGGPLTFLSPQELLAAPVTVLRSCRADLLIRVDTKNNITEPIPTGFKQQGGVQYGQRDARLFLCLAETVKIGKNDRMDDLLQPSARPIRVMGGENGFGQLFSINSRQIQQRRIGDIAGNGSLKNLGTKDPQQGSLDLGEIKCLMAGRIRVETGNPPLTKHPSDGTFARGDGAGDSQKNHSVSRDHQS